jgi:hypothetical protein
MQCNRVNVASVTLSYISNSNDTKAAAYFVEELCFEVHLHHCLVAEEAVSTLASSTENALFYVKPSSYLID